MGAALSSNVLTIHPDQGQSGKWKTTTVIRQPWTPVEGWALPEQPPLITGAIALTALLHHSASHIQQLLSYSAGMSHRISHTGGCPGGRCCLADGVNVWLAQTF